MAIRIQDSAVVTDVGTGKVVLSDGSTLKLIEATDLPGGSGGGGGGGGGGLPVFTHPAISLIPAYFSNGVSTGLLTASGSMRAYLLPAGDYTGMGVALIPASTAAAADVRMATYAVSGADLTGGSLIADLGRLQRNSGDAEALLKTSATIGVQSQPFMLAMFVGASSGPFRMATVTHAGVPIPASRLSLTSTAWRGDASVPYPGAGAVPATLPAYTLSFGNPSISVMSFLAHV